MTGLSEEVDKILEVACLVTDSDLNIIAEGPNIIIHQPEEVLNSMNNWCKKQHAKTGLTEASIQSNVTVAQAERDIMKFLQKFVTEKASPLAGNSIYMDRLFLRKFMPTVDEYLHYRIIDVSSVKELCRRWNVDVYKCIPKKSFTHRALGDIKESVEEMKYYKKNLFRV